MSAEKFTARLHKVLHQELLALVGIDRFWHVRFDKCCLHTFDKKHQMQMVCN